MEQERFRPEHMDLERDVRPRAGEEQMAQGSAPSEVKPLEVGKIEGSGTAETRRKFEYWVFWMILFLQIVFLVCVGVLCYKLGAWWAPAGLALLGYGVSAVVFDYRMKRQIDAPMGVRRFTLLWWLMAAGIFLLFLIPASFAVALAERTSWGEGITVGVAGVGLAAMLAVLLALASTASLDAGRAPWVALGTALIVLPFLVGWVTGSAFWWGWILRSSADSAWIRIERTKADREITARARQDTSRCPDEALWMLDGKPMRVAVALSGGGYRAAITHAGVLAALDEHCVPIGYMTTVSGGSIIGAYYALGFMPLEFARQLYRGKPGLSNDLLEIRGVFRDWFDPLSSSAETYSYHFRRAFFGDKTLGDLQEPPVLIVNATDLEAEGDAAREIFFNGRPPWQYKAAVYEFDPTTQLADVVAASGAFPGAFQPKRIRWITKPAKPGAPGSVHERKFVDGGVVENLGLEGLDHYLALERAGGQRPERPHLLIISDASRHGGEEQFLPKIEVVKLLNRSQGISYDTLHRHLYARYTGKPEYVERTAGVEVRFQVASRRYEDIDDRWTGKPENLFTVVLPITARQTATVLDRYPNCQFKRKESGRTVQGTVSRLPTLEELNWEQAEQGFWLGYALGTIYWAAIDCARFRVRSPDKTCPYWRQLTDDVKCPTVSLADKPGMGR